ncbi:SRPBCC family protein [Mycobacterium arosiense]|uniref:SRPBCC family protein n=1 Tax=Mycobacterium arosiense ATCC BAA-1401 = DSM 45069 TaxID=1265311 RepID=A0A1W9Z688_MYCAI|nr:SRPBCC family protein [Mycobacterium arosiense]ORA07852.1 SRPBCC family protein [Mycobacterium arosiense ATCC BAA-1401 = DSM 45069]
MAHSLVVDQSVIAPVAAQDAFDRTLPIPLPTLFHRWYGPFPPIKQVREQTGAWDAAGQTRIVHLAGGARMREELTSVDPPRSFGYRLSEITGPMALLVDHIVGEWVFTPAAGGTEITWRWDIRPRSALTAWALPLLGRWWKGYARRALRHLSALLTG